MRTCDLTLMLVALVGLSPCSKGESMLPEAGPEERGLRLRFIATPSSAGGVEGYDVRVDLINTSPGSVMLRAHHWRSGRHDGGFKEFLEAAVSIESYPPIEPWLGQVMAAQEGTTEPEHALKPGETLPVNWRTKGRHLKNGVSDPLEVQNPEFTEDGLHSIHATIVLVAGGQPVRLRSNEQLVPIGGSRKMPKHTYGPLWGADEKTRTAALGLGSLDHVQLGDRFVVHTGNIGMTWTLTITNVQADHSLGTLKPSPTDPLPAFPVTGNYGALIPKNAAQ